MPPQVNRIQHRFLDLKPGNEVYSRSGEHSMDTAEIKRTLRRRMATTRDGLPETARDAGATAAMERALTLPAFADADAVLTYMAIGSEVGTNGLISRILGAGKQLVLPRVCGDELMLHRITDPATELVSGRWNIPEPKETLPTVSPADIGLFLLPGLAFDEAGGRLGYGRGFFDRILAQTGGITAGLAFGAQVIEAVPTEPWDVPLNFIVTPDRLIHCHREMG